MQSCSGQVHQLVLPVEPPHPLVERTQPLQQLLPDPPEDLLTLLAVLLAGQHLQKLLPVSRGLDGQLGTIPDHPVVLVPEGRIVGLAEDVRHGLLEVAQPLEGDLDEGEEPHEAEQVAAGGVPGLVLVGGLEVLVVAPIVHVDLEAHLHLDVAEEPRVALESLVVLSHDPDFVRNVGKGDPEEGVEKFEHFAELQHQLEEGLELDLPFFLKPPQNLSRVLQNEIRRIVLLHDFFLHSNFPIIAQNKTQGI